MSIFQPLDVRGPDQRRKALMAKLAGQSRRNQDMPLAAARLAGMGRSMPSQSGRPFHNASDFRGFHHPALTQRSMLPPALLAALGQVGHAGLDSEVSPGPGQGIRGHGLGEGPRPDLSGDGGDGNAIPVQDETYGLAPQAPEPQRYGGSGGYNDYQPMPGPIGPTAAAAGAPYQGSPVAAQAAAAGGSGQFSMPKMSNGNGLVDLGGGLYYDPVTDSIRGGR